MRLILAIQCFFAVLFGSLLPKKALPPPEEPEESKQERERLQAEGVEKDRRIDALQAEAKELNTAKAALEAERDAASKASDDERKAAKASLEEAQGELTQVQEKVEGLRASQKETEGKLSEARNHGALALLSWLQREGRLIDFLKEDIDDYEDEQVGAAVRAIHKGCLKVLTEGLDLVAILEGEEESPVQVDEGFDPVAIQLTGNVKGDPPFKGTLMHHGWRAERVQVPVPETVDPQVLAPAEVEL